MNRAARVSGGHRKLSSISDLTWRKKLKLELECLSSMTKVNSCLVDEKGVQVQVRYRFLHGGRFRPSYFSSGKLSTPGGHLEFGESFEETARREILEETGLNIKDVTFLTASNDIFAEEKRHYVTIFMKAKVTDTSAQPQVS
jgi:8-oxo-dGTP pyrophosphatase MutT (NUDIX family)